MGSGWQVQQEFGLTFEGVFRPRPRRQTEPADPYSGADDGWGGTASLHLCQPWADKRRGWQC